jgi:hypothetical protein
VVLGPGDPVPPGAEDAELVHTERFALGRGRSVTVLSRHETGQRIAAAEEEAEAALQALSSTVGRRMGKECAVQ